MSLYIVDIHGEIEGDYELIRKYEEPKAGKWIQDGRVDDDGNIYFYCSNCKRGDTHAKGQKVPYCWWCGARMEVENDK